MTICKADVTYSKMNITSNISQDANVVIIKLLKTNRAIAKHKRCNLSLHFADLDNAAPSDLLKNNVHIIFIKIIELTIAGKALQATAMIIVIKDTMNSVAGSSITCIVKVNTEMKIDDSNIGTTQVKRVTFKYFLLISL